MLDSMSENESLTLSGENDSEILPKREPKYLTKEDSSRPLPKSTSFVPLLDVEGETIQRRKTVECNVDLKYPNKQKQLQYLK